MPNYKYPSPEYYIRCNQYISKRFSTDPLYFTSMEFMEYNLLAFMGTEVQEKAVNKLIQHLISTIEQKTNVERILKQYGL